MIFDNGDLIWVGYFCFGMFVEIGYDFIVIFGFFGLMWKNDNIGSFFNGSGEFFIMVIILGFRSVGDN